MWFVVVADGGESRGFWAFNMVCSWAAAEAHLLVRLHAEVSLSLWDGTGDH